MRIQGRTERKMDEEKSRELQELQTQGHSDESFQDWELSDLDFENDELI